VSEVRKALAIMRKDLKEVFSSRQLIISIVVPALVFGVILPIVFGLSFTAEDNSTEIGILNQTIYRYDGVVLRDSSEVIAYWMMNYMLPILLMVLPCGITCVVAADSIAGEKERKTLEALLLMPVSNFELFIGKMLAPFVIGVVIASVSAIVSMAISSYFSISLLGKSFLNISTWAITILLLIPTVAFMAITFSVIVSVYAKGVREAQQMSGAIIVPIVIILIASATNMAVFAGVSRILLALLFLLTGLIFSYVSSKLMDREKLILRV